MNVAVTDLASELVTEQLRVPLHAPDHPANRAPTPGEASILTRVPDLYVSVQLLLQTSASAAGVKMTDPVASPALV